MIVLTRIIHVLRKWSHTSSWLVAFGENGLCTPYQYVRVFNPHLPSNRSVASYVRQENVKRRSYEQRIRDVEHASFVPASFSTTGGMGKHVTALYKRIASILAEKTDEKYSTVIDGFDPLPYQFCLIAVLNQFLEKFSQAFRQCHSFFLLSDHKHGGVYSLQVNPYCMRGGGEATPPQST